MMANRPPVSTVIELTRNALGEMSDVACSPCAGVATLLAGRQPIGQNGLRPLSSIAKEDLFFTSSCAGSPSTAGAGAGVAAGFVSVAGAACFFSPAAGNCATRAAIERVQISFFIA